MGENNYPVITISGAEWQAAQDAAESARHSLQQLKAEIAALSNKIDLAWTACDFNEHRRCTERLRQLSAV